MKPSFYLTCMLLFCALHSHAQEISTKENPIFTKAEVDAYYLGGDTAFLHFLNHNLRYPDSAVSNRIEGTVIVQFIVNKDSTISDVHAISGPENGGLREEAVGVISRSGKWVPAIQNHYIVRSYKKQPIIFKLPSR
jgi:protein TonB